MNLERIKSEENSIQFIKVKKQMKMMYMLNNNYNKLCKKSEERNNMHKNSYKEWI